MPSAEDIRDDLDGWMHKGGWERRRILHQFMAGSENDVDYKSTHQLLHKVLHNAEEHPHLHIMLTAMADAGCSLNPAENIVVKKCGADVGKLMGLFNGEKNQLELCKETFGSIYSEVNRSKLMKTTLSFLLIQAFDHCQAKVNLKTPEHDMCSVIRAASLSGQCSSDFLGHKTALLTTKKNGYQSCVKRSAVMSFMYRHPSWKEDDVYSLLYKMYPVCFHDYSPHDRLPYDNKQAELSYKAYMSRNRYQV